jgi:hypothetical protein
MLEPVKSQRLFSLVMKALAIWLDTKGYMIEERWETLGAMQQAKGSKRRWWEQPQVKKVDLHQRH